jgi:hypothetical protein
VFRPAKEECTQIVATLLHIVTDADKAACDFRLKNRTVEDALEGSRNRMTFWVTSVKTTAVEDRHSNYRRHVCRKTFTHISVRVS